VRRAHRASAVREEEAQPVPRRRVQTHRGGQHPVHQRQHGGGVGERHVRPERVAAAVSRAAARLVLSRDAHEAAGAEVGEDEVALLRRCHFRGERAGQVVDDQHAHHPAARLHRPAAVHVRVVEVGPPHVRRWHAELEAGGSAGRHAPVDVVSQPRGGGVEAVGVQVGCVECVPAVLPQRHALDAEVVVEVDVEHLARRHADRGAGHAAVVPARPLLA